MTNTRKKYGGANSRGRSYNRRNNRSQRRNNSSENINEEVVDIIKNVKNKKDLEPLIRLLKRIRDTDGLNISFNSRRGKINDAITSAHTSAEIKFKIRNLLSRHPLSDDDIDRIMDTPQGPPAINNFETFYRFRPRRGGSGVKRKRNSAPTPEERMEYILGELNNRHGCDNELPQKISNILGDDVNASLEHNKEPTDFDIGRIYEVLNESNGLSGCSNATKDEILGKIEELISIHPANHESRMHAERRQRTQGGGKRTKRNHKSKRRNMRTRR